MGKEDTEIKLLRRVLPYGPKWIKGAVIKTDAETAAALVKKGAAVIYDEKQRKADQEHEKALEAVKKLDDAAKAAQATTAAKATEEAEKAAAAAARTPTPGEARRNEVATETSTVTRSS